MPRCGKEQWRVKEGLALIEGMYIYIYYRYIWFDDDDDVDDICSSQTRIHTFVVGYMGIHIVCMCTCLKLYKFEVACLLADLNIEQFHKVVNDCRGFEGFYL